MAAVLESWWPASTILTKVIVANQKLVTFIERRRPLASKRSTNRALAPMAVC